MNENEIIKKRPGRKPMDSPERVEKICDAIARGSTIDNACKIAGITYQTFKVWMRTKTSFSSAIEKAKKDYQDWYDSQLVSDCKRSLRELICGYEWDETTTETATNKDGKKNITKTKIVHKRAAPNATAIIFALCNRDPENWKNRIAQDVNGKINVENEGPGISLANVPDSLLAQVIEAINGK